MLCKKKIKENDKSNEKRIRREMAPEWIIKWNIFLKNKGYFNS